MVQSRLPDNPKRVCASSRIVSSRFVWPRILDKHCRKGHCPFRAECGRSKRQTRRIFLQVRGSPYTERIYSTASPRFTHDTKTGVFSDLDIKRIELCDGQKSPDNCPVCPIQEENDLKKEARALKDEFGNLDGVAFAGISYHLEDFVLYRANEGPANIGYITHVAFPKKNIAKVTMRKVGRISDLGHVLPAGTKRDEVSKIHPQSLESETNVFISFPSKETAFPD